MRFSLSRTGVCLLTVLLLSAVASSQPMSAPKELSVSSDGTIFRGRWKAVPGASHYEVWTKLYGNWKFDPKNPDLSPFTSSFEVPGSDDRIWFRVRAVSASGQAGAFSEEVQAISTEVATGAGALSERPEGSGKPVDDFDPEAPAPEPPSSLFAVWTDTREIRLVWQSSPKATRYTVEELVNGSWTSLTKIEYPKPTTAIIKDKPQPGPFQFRVRAIGRNGRASEPSRPTTAKISR